MGRAGAGGSNDFLKKKYILLVGYLTCSAKYMFFKLPIYHQNKGEEVCLCSAITMFIHLCYLYLLSLCLYLSVFCLCINTKIHK